MDLLRYAGVTHRAWQAPQSARKQLK